MPVYYIIRVNLEEFFENLGEENMSDIRLDSFVEIHAASRNSKMQSNKKLGYPNRCKIKELRRKKRIHSQKDSYCK